MRPTDSVPLAPVPPPAVARVVGPAVLVAVGLMRLVEPMRIGLPRLLTVVREAGLAWLVPVGPPLPAEPMRIGLPLPVVVRVAGPMRPAEPMRSGLLRSAAAVRTAGLAWPVLVPIPVGLPLPLPLSLSVVCAVGPVRLMGSPWIGPPQLLPRGRSVQGRPIVRP